MIQGNLSNLIRLAFIFDLAVIGVGTYLFFINPKDCKEESPGLYYVLLYILVVEYSYFTIVVTIQLKFVVNLRQIFMKNPFFVLNVLYRIKKLKTQIHHQKRITKILQEFSFNYKHETSIKKKLSNLKEKKNLLEEITTMQT